MHDGEGFDGEDDEHEDDVLVALFVSLFVASSAVAVWFIARFIHAALGAVP